MSLISDLLVLGFFVLLYYGFLYDPTDPGPHDSPESPDSTMLDHLIFKD